MTALTIQQALELALQHHQAGRLGEAEGIYRQILAQQPGHIEAMHYLGVIAAQTGHNDEAVELIRRVVSLKPDHPDAYNHLGNALKNRGQFDEAITAYRRAIAMRPNNAQAISNLGVALRNKGQLDQAIAAYRQAISIQPSYIEAHNNLGNALREKGQLDQAIACYRTAIELRPNYPEAYYNLGNILGERGHFEESAAALGRAIALRQDYAEAHCNLGNALKCQWRLDESVASYRRAIALKPDFATAHHNLALALLQRGDWDEGWLEYEWRWRVRDFPSPRRGFSQPLWDGGDLNGRSILLHVEQGFGDAIQFIRYLPLVVGRGGRVFVEVLSGLIRLLRQLPGVERWIEYGQPVPAFDVHCPLMSLPCVFKTTPQNIPEQKDILRPDPELAQAWRRRMEQQPAGLKVGLVWAGSPTQKNNHNRSMALSMLAPLSEVERIQFYSLQKGQAGMQAAQSPAGMRIIDWTNELHDFADTAALIDQLDLVISVCTSVAHLSGAMAKPVWLMLSAVPDWRWLSGRDDSPWYPTMRLFRQGTLGDWPGVVRRVADALAGLHGQGPA